MSELKNVCALWSEELIETIKRKKIPISAGLEDGTKFKYIVLESIDSELWGAYNLTLISDEKFLSLAEELKKPVEEKTNEKNCEKECESKEEMTPCQRNLFLKNQKLELEIENMEFNKEHRERMVDKAKSELECLKTVIQKNKTENEILKIKLAFDRSMHKKYINDDVKEPPRTIKSVVFDIALETLRENYLETGFIGEITYDEYKDGSWEYTLTEPEGSISFDQKSPSVEEQIMLGVI